MTTKDCPRFLPENLNAGVAPDSPGDAFQSFLFELFKKDYPGLVAFPTGGRDGAIDLSHSSEASKNGESATRTVFESKFVESETINLIASQKKWSEVFKHLRGNLSDPEKGQSQYRPWLRQKPTIKKYLFCLSARLSNQDIRDELKKKIEEDLASLSKTHDDLSHLANIKVVVLDWGNISEKLLARPRLLHRWFKSAWPSGFLPLDAPSELGGFREYLEDPTLPYYSSDHHIAHEAAPLGMTIPVPEKLLRDLENSSNSGLIIYGDGGIGKTRLCLEIGKKAKTPDWTVMRPVGSMDPELLDELITWPGADCKILLVLDYVETEGYFEAFVDKINKLNDMRELGLFYVANCRTSFYFRTAINTPRHMAIELSPVSPSAKVWFASYREATINHILSHRGVEPTKDRVDMCRNIPVMAVFLAFINENYGQDELDILVNETDFSGWIRRHLGKRLNRPIPMETIAKSLAMFPLFTSIFEDLPDEPYGGFLKELASDRLIIENKGRDRWELPHDVFADRIILDFLCGEARHTQQIFIKSVLSESEQLGSLRSTLIALQRIGSDERLDAIDWQEIISQRLQEAAYSWRPARDVVIKLSILTTKVRLFLLAGWPSYWEGAEQNSLFRRSLGSLAREIWREEDIIHDETTRSVFENWLDKAVKVAGEDNFILAWGLRVAKERLRTSALAWIRTHPANFDTHFLLVAWLESGLHAEEISNDVKSWSKTFQNHKNLSFVARAWLDAKGEKELVRDAIEEWLKEHKTTLVAQFVYKSWLDAKGEKDLVRDAIEEWLKEHKTTLDARFVYKSWLDAKGEKDLVRDAIKEWLKEHKTTLDANYVYKSWLDAKGEKELVRDAIKEWLKEHKTTLDARFVYKSWLDAKGEKDLVRDAIEEWLKEHKTTLVAQFVYKPWLDAKGEKDLVRDAIKEWLKEHKTTLDTQFVYQSWLDAKGEKDLVRDAIKEWLKEHKTTLVAQFVYKPWLDAKGEKDLIRDAIGEWLIIHGYGDEADYVCRSWLEAGGDFSFVRDYALHWLHQNRDNIEAVYLSKFIAKEQILPEESIIDILQWCQIFPEHEDALWRFTQLAKKLLIPEIAEDVCATCEAILASWITSNKRAGTTVSKQFSWAISWVLASCGNIPKLNGRAKKLFSAWLRHPDSYGDVDQHIHIQRETLIIKFVEIVETGEMDVSSDRNAMERFLINVSKWEPDRKLQAIEILSLLKNSHPAQDLWDIVTTE